MVEGAETQLKVQGGRHLRGADWTDIQGGELIQDYFGSCCFSDRADDDGGILTKAVHLLHLKGEPQCQQTEFHCRS